MSGARVIIAGTNSGCGKTTISIGIMAALIKKGLVVQPFKTGPDYIDPMFHTFITGRISRNLDSWMLHEDTVKYLFQKNSAGSDISIVEGVMGLYDGFGGTTDLASTAHISRIIKAPVILVVNAEGMALSIAAMLHGYKTFGNGADIRGVIFNGIKSKPHFELLKDIVEKNTGIKALGYVPFLEECSLESRHLGLIPIEEIPGLREKVNKLADAISSTVDLEMLIKLAEEAIEENILTKTVLPEEFIKIYPAYSADNSTSIASNSIVKTKFKLGIAKDRAFNFYYQDNIDLLEDLGAEVVYFSPMVDKHLPEGLNGLYLGGGYPEVFAEELQANVEMKKSVLEFINNGNPTYAECGGMMYLCETLVNKSGVTYEMVGAIAAETRMTNSLKRFGYAEMQAVNDCILAEKDWKIKVHEFHYSETELTKDDTPTCMKISKKRYDNNVVTWTCGYKSGNLLAGYPHIHFWSNPTFAVRFAESCKTLSRNNS